MTPWRNVAVVLFIVGAVTFVHSEAATPPTAKTKYGQLVGKVLTTPKGSCDAYLGVPFAEPPLGGLRFQKPQEPKNWSGVRDATQHGPMCIAIGNDGRNPMDQSEDCLVLNLFAPRPLPPGQKLPVMVFIHGGGFSFGSAREFGDEGPCENLVSRGVILVMIQYRLFMYGFFSTGDEAAPGNYALWDQIAALKWVKENIENFGGDPTRVTIFGESAGGASVSYLTYTPVAKDLFQQSISQSGSAFSSWAGMADASVESGKKLARSAKCTDLLDSASYVKCLRRLTTVELQDAYNAMPDLFPDDNSHFYDVWCIRKDGKLFTSSEFKELDTQRPAVIGVNTMEMPTPNATDIPLAHEILKSTFTRAFRGTTDITLKNVLEQTARYVYIDSKGDPNDDAFVYEQAIKMEADVTFRAAGPHEATVKKAAGSAVWVYNFDFWNDKVFPPGYPFEKGATHAHELCYIFLLSVPNDSLLYCPQTYEGMNRHIADQLGEMWTNFAKTGDPSPSRMHWPQFQTLTNASVMTIRSDLSIEPHFYLDVTNFWFDLVPSIGKYFPTGQKNCASSVASSFLIAGVLLAVMRYI